MKRFSAVLLAIVFAVTLLAACGSQQKEVRAVSKSFDYNSEVYSQAHNWYISAEDSDYRADKVTIDGKESDARIFGENDEFIYLVDSGEVFHKDSVEYPRNNADNVSSIGSDTLDITAPEKISKFCEILNGDDFSSEKPKELRLIGTLEIRYKNCHAVFRGGAIVGSRADYFIRLDCIGGDDISVNPRYYPVSVDLLSKN